MATRRQISEAKRKREAARLVAYQTKASEVRPFVVGKLRAGRRMTAADKSAITKLHRQIFGGEYGSGAPSLLPLDPKQRDHYDVIPIRDKRRLAKTKRDLGQRTSPRVKAIFIRRKPLPAAAGQSEPAEIIHRTDRPDFVVDSHIIGVVEPIDPEAYALDPRKEEARAVEALWIAFGEIQKWLAHSRKNNWIVHPDDAVFSALCGGHEALVQGGSEEDLAAELQGWRNRYNQRDNEADHVVGWLIGIKMLIRLGAAGREQYTSAIRAQTARRAARKEWRKRLAQYRKDIKPSHPKRRKPGRQRKRRT